ncbi:hypothetical protein [Microbispora sp. CSR-4]|uniref:DUF6907 domain-containing protein n=1 Tax=Microbispora sp. CSR-4 TaxID=2592813 RepID=UPI0011CA41BA|nr:hypothetical protein [Microbispora sp. CSR-4]
MTIRTGVTADATTPVVPHTLNVANLTPQQRGGLACVRCGSSDQPMIPVVVVDGVQLFQCITHDQIPGEDLKVRAAYLQGVLKGTATPPADRPGLAAAAQARLADLSRYDRPAPAWLTRPCPAWCTERHGDRDYAVDRNHRGHTLVTPLLTMDFVNCGSPDEPRYEPVELMCDLVQHHREAEPRINIGDTNDAFSDDLSLGEAEEFARHLFTLVALGRNPARAQARGSAAGCRPWCVRHDDVNDLCNGFSEPTAAGLVGLTHVDREGSRVWFGDRHMSPAEAEQLASVLLAQAARVRSNTPQ